MRAREDPDFAAFLGRFGTREENRDGRRERSHKSSRLHKSCGEGEGGCSGGGCGGCGAAVAATGAGRGRGARLVEVEMGGRGWCGEKRA